MQATHAHPFLVEMNVRVRGRLVAGHSEPRENCGGAKAVALGIGATHTAQELATAVAVAPASPTKHVAVFMVPPKLGVANRGGEPNVPLYFHSIYEFLS